MVQEIEIPLDLKRVVLMGAEETKLGDKKGALKQYRKGNLHIREYEDRLTVHADKVDPREDQMGHLIHDAQEVLEWKKNPDAFIEELIEQPTVDTLHGAIKDKLVDINKQNHTNRK